MVAGFRPRWADARWSFLYDKATRYARAAANGRGREAARRARGGEEVPVPVNGPMINAAVWTWEVPALLLVRRRRHRLLVRRDGV